MEPDGSTNPRSTLRSTGQWHGSEVVHLEHPADDFAAIERERRPLTELLDHSMPAS
jgi:hypothetical protein